MGNAGSGFYEELWFPCSTEQGIFTPGAGSGAPHAELGIAGIPHIPRGLGEVPRTRSLSDILMP